MDLLTAITTVGTIVGPAVVKIIQDVWDDYRAGRRTRQGMVVDPGGMQREMPYLPGAVDGPYQDWDDFDTEPLYDEPAYAEPLYDEPPILMRGRFLFEDSFADWADLLLEQEEKWIMFLAVDQESGEVYFFDFDFEGYAISLWPGLYSFYAFVVDPVLDDVLAFGYPGSDDWEDPNPIALSGEGILDVDFYVFDAAEG